MQVPSHLFRFVTLDPKTFTVQSFANTRFGTHRPRPDHEKMRRIKCAAACQAISDAERNSVQGRDICFNSFRYSICNLCEKYRAYNSVLETQTPLAYYLSSPRKNGQGEKVLVRIVRT